MALTAHALTTLQAVKDELGITSNADDSLLERRINAVSALIERLCGRHFETGSVVETFPAEGQVRFALARTPVTSITSVSYDGTVLDAGNYSLEDGEAGLLRMIYAAVRSQLLAAGVAMDMLPGTARRLYSVTYVGGYVMPAASSGRNLPEDLEEACIIAVVTSFRKKGRDQSIQQEALGDWSATYAGGVSGADPLPPAAMKMIEPYRRIIV
jgi:hypothetical protein